MTDHDLAGAWDAVHAATPPRWQVGRPYRHEERGGGWEMYLWLPTGKARGGRPKVEWIAVGPTELQCLLEAARCLRILGAGEWPR